MATGFMLGLEMFCSRNCKWLIAALLAWPACVLAAGISVIGVFPGKGAVVVVDGGAPLSVRIGHRLGDATLVSVDKVGAVFEEGGRRHNIALGPHLPGPSAAGGQEPQARLTADGRGHYVANSTVNGASMQMLVDTGATMVSIPGKDARRIGLDFRRGVRAIAQTANGPAPIYQVKLDSVRIGAIELLNVDAVVIDGGGLSQSLLGMSFLNRVEMRNDGGEMTLKKRY